MSIIKYDYNNVVQLFVKNLSESKEYHKNYLELISKIKQMDGVVDIGSFCYGRLFFKELDENSNLRKRVFSAIGKTDQFENIPLLNALYIESAMIHILEPPIYKGRFFESEDFEESDEIPLVVGYAYKDIFEIGQTFTVTDESLGMTGTYKVIGILDKGSY